MEIGQAAQSVEAALAAAHRRIRDDLRAKPRGVIQSYDGQPGLWETAEAIGILHWEATDKALLPDAMEAILNVQADDGGFAPSPDITSRASYTESTARVVLSLAPVCPLAPGYSKLEEAITAAVKWLLRNQDRECGGWGSHRGLMPRLFPTSLAIQALAVATSEVDSLSSRRCAEAIGRGAQWIDNIRNDDGGFGAREGAESNMACSGHAAWGLTAARIEVPNCVCNYISEGLGHGSIPAITDKVYDPLEAEGPGRFEVLILGPPLALIGAVCARLNIYDARVLDLLKGILGEQEDGVWSIQTGRFVWPTYMHVAALRLWLAVHTSHANSSTSDFSALSPGTIKPRKRSHSPIDSAVQPPDDWRGRFEELSPRQREALAACARGEQDKEAAAKLGVSHRTVENHRQLAFGKLGIPLTNRPLATAIAVRAGLVPDSEQLLAEHFSADQT